MKKLWTFLSSMRFAIILLVILAAACAGGSFISQGLSYAEYEALYSERAAGLIIGLGLDDVFHAWWFLLLTAFLCGNLLLCNLIRLPQLVRRTKDAADPAKAGAPAVTLEGIADPEPLFAKLRMPKAAETTDAEGRPLRFSVRNRVGLWGAWVCHLGILLLILGFALGQMTKEEYTVYGVPGQTKQIGGTDYLLKIRDFRVDRGEDGFAEQYTASLTVIDNSNENAPLAEDCSASVNHPGSAFGFKLYQNSTGDAATLTVRRDGKTVLEEVFCVGETYMFAPDPEKESSIVLIPWPAAENAEEVLKSNPLLLQLRSILRDEAEGERYDPSYAYLIYIGDKLYTMNVQAEGESIPDFTPYEVRFSEARSYTLIQVKRDRFTPLAFLGGLLTLIGLFLAFYLQLRKLWAVQNEDGTWTVHGSSPKGGALFAERVKEAAAAP